MHRAPAAFDVYIIVARAAGSQRQLSAGDAGGMIDSKLSAPKENDLRRAEFQARRGNGVPDARIICG
jgi:hypothetical protein